MLVRQVDCDGRHRFQMELRRSPQLDGVPLSSQDVTSDLGDLMDEALTSAVLADVFPEEIDRLDVRIEPQWTEPPVVSQIEVRLRATFGGTCAEYRQEFRGGPWSRTSQQVTSRLREEGTLTETETAYCLVVALPEKDGSAFEPPPLQTPQIGTGTLEELGVRQLADGETVPDRPVLANKRLVEDAVNACLAAGARETGGVTLGRLVRLPEPLAGTSTRVVTVLTTCLEDRRHSGDVNQWSISPDALVEAARIADLRGLGESVMTVSHTHGFSAECGNCNSNAACPLAECTHVSLMDYQVLETLFPAKSTLMPIAGRRMGAAGNRPVLEIHAWRGGQVRPIRWQCYLD